MARRFDSRVTLSSFSSAIAKLVIERVEPWTLEAAPSPSDLPLEDEHPILSSQVYGYMMPQRGQDMRLRNWLTTTTLRNHHAVKPYLKGEVGMCFFSG